METRRFRCCHSEELSWLRRRIRRKRAHKTPIGTGGLAVAQTPSPWPYQEARKQGTRMTVLAMMHK
jgi:hypothetical protein